MDATCISRPKDAHDMWVIQESRRADFVAESGNGMLIDNVRFNKDFYRDATLE